MPEDHNEQSLIQGLINKNEESFRILVEQYKDYILNICYHFLGNRHDAEDMVQEVFVEIYHSASKFRQESKLSTWIYRIAVNKSLNIIRSKKKFFLFEQLDRLYGIKPVELPADKSYEGEQRYIQSERDSILYSAIDSLPDNQRIAFTLHKFEGMAYKDIAEIMNISIPAVESLIHRSKKNLQRKLYHYFRKK